MITNGANAIYEKTVGILTLFEQKLFTDLRNLFKIGNRLLIKLVLLRTCLKLIDWVPHVSFWLQLRCIFRHSNQLWLQNPPCPVFLTGSPED